MWFHSHLRKPTTERLRPIRRAKLPKRKVKSDRRNLRIASVLYILYVSVAFDSVFVYHCHTRIATYLLCASFYYFWRCRLWGLGEAFGYECSSRRRAIVSSIVSSADGAYHQNENGKIMGSRHRRAHRKSFCAGNNEHWEWVSESGEKCADAAK